MKEFDIDQAIEETLSSLDGMAKTKAPEGFHQSLAQKMIFRKKEQSVWLNRMKYAVAAMIAMLIVNTILFIQNENITKRTKIMESLSEEWNVTSNEF